MPSTVIAKVGAAAPTGAVAGPVAAAGAGREVAFYAGVRDAVAAPTPRCWYAGEGVPGHPVVLLEDLSAARPGDALAGASPRDVRAVLRRMAPLWRPGAGQPFTDVLPPWSTDGLPAAERESRYRRRWRDVSGVLGPVLPSYVRQLATRLADTLALVVSDLAASRWCAVAHADLHLDNVMFRQREGGETAFVLDWERACLGSPAVDVFPFLAMSLSAEDHERHAADIVDELINEFVRPTGGVDDVAIRQTFVDDGRRALLSTLAGMVAWQARPPSGNPREAALRAAALGDGRLAHALGFWEADRVM